METSDKCVELFMAIHTVQMGIGPLPKDGVNDNKVFRSTFHSLDMVLPLLRRLCDEAGLCFVQGGAAGGGVTTRIVHLETGQWVQTIMDLPPAKQDPQAGASAVTYARRIALCAAFAISDKDDDGEGAMGRNGKMEAKMEEAFRGNERAVNAYLKRQKKIKGRETWREMSDEDKRFITKRLSAVVDAATKKTSKRGEEEDAPGEDHLPDTRRTDEYSDAEVNDLFPKEVE